MIIANGKTEGFNNKLFNNNKTNGFTIIEVVLVLAIAGLIFLVVFLALPALQKSQRDNARKQDVAKIVAGLQQYLTDNDNSFVSYLGTYQVLSTVGYYGNMAQATRVSMEGRNNNSCRWVNSDYSYAKVRIGCNCTQVMSTGNSVIPSRSFAVYIELENGGVYCQDS